MSNNNYRQTEVAGESWVRAKRIVIEHPLGGAIRVKFVEEKVVVLGESHLAQDEGILELTIDQEGMHKTIDVIDPITREPLGQQVTFGALYAAIFSAYLQAAEERDGPEPEEVTAGEGGEI